MPTIDTNAMKDRMQGFLAGFSIGQRAVVMVAIVTLIGGGVLFTQWASKPAMTPLFSSLSTDDASAMTTELDGKGVKYKLTDGGSTILVPQTEVYQLRLDMAGAGLTAGSSEGYKLLDNGSSVTQSQFREHVNYQRALEGELDKTISSIDGVRGATVHLVIPEEDVFSGDSVKPTASVLIQTTPGKSIGSQSVQAIVNLVSTSVEGLSTEDVTVADSSGKLLSAQGVAGGDGTDQQNQQTAALETTLNSKIESLLIPVVGTGKAVVQTRTELNWDKSKTVSEQWNPTNKQAAVGSEKVDSEVYGGAGTGDAATGCIGTNTPVNGVCTPAQGAPGADAANGYNNYSGTKDFLNDRLLTETETAQGQPQRITVAVVLDANVPNVDVAAVENLVTQAAGLQVARGDTVTVSRLPFDQTGANSVAEQLKEAEKAESASQMMDLIKIGVTALIILVTLLILFITTKRRAKLYNSTPVSMAELDAAMPPLSPINDVMNAIEQAAPAVDSSPEALERAKVDREITDLIERQPDEVATLLRGWLADRRN